MEFALLVFTLRTLLAIGLEAIIFEVSMLGKGWSRLAGSPPNCLAQLTAIWASSRAWTAAISACSAFPRAVAVLKNSKKVAKIVNGRRRYFETIFSGFGRVRTSKLRYRPFAKQFWRLFAPRSAPNQSFREIWPIELGIGDVFDWKWQVRCFYICLLRGPL